jgi:hypothetical protein
MFGGPKGAFEMEVPVYINPESRYRGWNSTPPPSGSSRKNGGDISDGLVDNRILTGYHAGLLFHLWQHALYRAGSI